MMNSILVASLYTHRMHETSDVVVEYRLYPDLSHERTDRFWLWSLSISYPPDFRRVQL